MKKPDQVCVTVGVTSVAAFLPSIACLVFSATFTRHGFKALHNVALKKILILNSLLIFFILLRCSDYLDRSGGGVCQVKLVLVLFTHTNSVVDNS